MPQPRRRAGFAQKTKPRRFIAEILFADDLQRHRASEIDVERLVSDPHRTATQLDRFPVFASHQLVVVKPLGWLVRHPIERIPSNRRLTGLNRTAETLTKHADRAEFQCSRDFIAAARAGAFGLRAHSPRRPSATTSTFSNTTPASSDAKSTSITAGILLSGSTSNRVFPDTTRPPDHVSRQIRGYSDRSARPIGTAL